ncbi:DUF3325 domain-containing protein [Variovorax sp. KBW07]|uniref:DUF3325 domain-containing protein n=1 Tax=Variovorax sp. KBW07 TaxID=2153358 RepID=UPI000F56130A|nr:DUF3325 domain-containing protein [Variovorax sp. KBW07]RQO39710.1 DUF3325 domain-containing protein [Variovorax sp. KBW07]
MTVWYASLLSLALAHAGMAALSFAIDRHHEQLTQRRDEMPARRRVLLRVAGALLLIAAVVPCVMAWGGTVGPVAWLGFLSAGALLVALLLPYRPKGAAWLAACAAITGCAGLATALAGLLS